MVKKICILGSTGSIGTQALEVIEEHPDKFEVEVLTANSNWKLLVEQSIKFRPNTVVITNEAHYKSVSDELWNYGIKTYTGEKALEEVVEMSEIDIVLTALVGYVGLKSTISAIEAGKSIALANKETLVVAGDLISKLADERKVAILPVDSEHSAIFQCLAGEFHNPIEKIYLTASGGPFLNWNREQLQSVSVEQALRHPNWNMGAKISIDSATMMNKGLEVIEAKWLFQLESSQIDVIIHPQSIVHSIVQFKDGSMKAQMGLPDMKLPIQYALSYPNRITSSTKRFDFMEYPQLNFQTADKENFLNLQLAYTALEKKGNAACILNAANEVSNQAFLDGKIGFLEIAEINAAVMEKATFILSPTLDDYVSSNDEARNIAKGMLIKSK